ncbi:MAG: hypothetical protein M1826_006544 [Phylliscum demangeonii]|nr:MAG: hypothetical protein M1826_006544 [Phylliscum demangeonii]
MTEAAAQVARVPHYVANMNFEALLTQQRLAIREDNRVDTEALRGEIRGLRTEVWEMRIEVQVERHNAEARLR